MHEAVVDDKLNYDQMLTISNPVNTTAHNSAQQSARLRAA